MVSLYICHLFGKNKKKARKIRALIEKKLLNNKKR